MAALEDAGEVVQPAQPRVRLAPPEVRARLSAGVGGERVVALLKAMGHPLRLRIVALLCRGERHVGAIARQLGAPQPAVSQQLRILRAEALVAVRRVGGFARYHVRDGAVCDLVRSAEAASSALGSHPPTADRDP